MKRITSGLVIFLFSFSFACNQSPAGLSENEVVTTQATNGVSAASVKFRVETVASGLEVPWAFAFLPGGDALVTERPGRVRIIEKGKLRSEPVHTVADVEPSSESGLMDLSLHPKFTENKFLYIAYAYRGDGNRVRIVRFKFDGNKFIEPKTIIQDIPAAPNHAGTRARFGPDGKLYVTTGDATNWNLAQKLDSLAGKTLRLNDDGSVPADNPFVGQKSARPEIWSYGHRNAQGLAWSPAENLMFQTEHGPSGFEGKGGGADEVNIVERGKNYGWAEIWGNKTKDGMVAPLLEYTPACAPASGMFSSGKMFAEFKGNLFFGCLRGERIIRVVLDDRRVVKQENLLEKTYGRIREMAEAPDGSIWFSTSNRDGRGSVAKEDDRILRIVPVK